MYLRHWKGLSRKTIYGMTSVHIQLVFILIRNHAIPYTPPSGRVVADGLPLSCTLPLPTDVSYPPSWPTIRFSDVATSVSLTCMIHAHCALMAKLSSLLWCGGSHRNHRGQNQRSNPIAQSSNPFLLQLSISAWLTARYHDHRNYLSTTERDRVHFLLFCSIWSTFLSPIFPVLSILEWAQIMAGKPAHVILYDPLTYDPEFH